MGRQPFPNTEWGVRNAERSACGRSTDGLSYSSTGYGGDRPPLAGVPLSTLWCLLRSAGKVQGIERVWGREGLPRSLILIVSWLRPEGVAPQQSAGASDSSLRSE